MKLKANWDGLGIITSVACAIHCALLPALLSSLPVFGINIIHDPSFEWFMILLAIGIGIYALKHGYSKHHRNPLPVLIFTVGALFLISKQFFRNYETILLLLAVTAIIYAHFQNYRFCHKDRCSSAHHTH